MPWTEGLDVSTSVAPKRVDETSDSMESKKPPVFLKWVGSKRALCQRILSHFPGKIEGDYFEPFLGSGAIASMLGTRVSGKVMASDANTRLIDAFRAVQQCPDRLLSELATLQWEYDTHLGVTCEIQRKAQVKALYESKRALFNSLPPVVAKEDLPRAAALLIFLNRTSYSGLYRENKAGQFNVPCGLYGLTSQSYRVLQEQKVIAAAKAVSKWDISAQSWQSIEPKKNDFVYLDPPYDGTFSGYGSSGWRDADLVAIATAARQWVSGGAHVAVSNAPTQRVMELFPGFTAQDLSRCGSINSNTGGRRRVHEILLTSFSAG